MNLTQKRSKVGEHAFLVLCWIALALPLLMLAVLVADVVIDAWPRLEASFLSSMPSRKADQAGIYPALIGSLWVIGLTAAISLPIGVAAAIYLEEYGKRNWFAQVIEVNIANLAGVPSVIYGLLGLELFVRVMGMGASILAGACTLALLILPIVIMASREALRTIPLSIREGCLALGSTRWQSIRQVVLPMALPGILTGSILSISRAIGETAPLIVVGAVAYISFLPEGLDSEFTALPIQIFNWVSMPKKDFQVNAAAGIVVLLATLLVLNAIAIFLRNKYQKRNLS